MKKLAKTLLFVLSIGLMTGAYSCSDDATPALDPNVFCDENLCAIDEDLQQKCQDFLLGCLATQSGVNYDECLITALSICRD